MPDHRITLSNVPAYVTIQAHVYEDEHGDIHCKPLHDTASIEHLDTTALRITAECKVCGRLFEDDHTAIRDAMEHVTECGEDAVR